MISVSDADGRGIRHSVLYTNDALVAVNSTSSGNLRFELDTTMMDSGDCTLTVVAVDNALNSNWTAITLTVYPSVTLFISSSNSATEGDFVLALSFFHHTNIIFTNIGKNSLQ